MSARFRFGMGACLFMAFSLGMASWVVADDSKPMSMAGTWRWKWTDAEGVVHHHVLEVEGEGKTLSARERFDEEKPVKINDMKIEGKTVTFSVTRGTRHAAYKGEFKSADHIDGTVGTSGADNSTEEYGWSADREDTDEDATPKSD